jgi:hypothetical protein
MMARTTSWRRHIWETSQHICSGILIYNDKYPGCLDQFFGEWVGKWKGVHGSGVNIGEIAILPFAMKGEYQRYLAFLLSVRFISDLFHSVVQMKYLTATCDSHGPQQVFYIKCSPL